MPRMIFVNLPVADLAASMKFYEALGFTNNPQFTDATAACMVWSEAIHVMLLTHEKWNTFTTRPICPNTSSEVSVALSMDDRDAVDAFNAAAAANGGTGDINPIQDLGFMYGRDVADRPDRDPDEPEAQAEADGAGERAVHDCDGARGAAEQDRLGQRPVDRDREARHFVV